MADGPATSVTSPAIRRLRLLPFAAAIALADGAIGDTAFGVVELLAQGCAEQSHGTHDDDGDERDEQTVLHGGGALVATLPDVPDSVQDLLHCLSPSWAVLPLRGR